MFGGGRRDQGFAAQTGRRRLRALLVVGVSVGLGAGVAQAFAAGSRDGRSIVRAGAQASSGRAAGRASAPTNASRIQALLPESEARNPDGSRVLVAVPVPAAELSDAPGEFAKDLRAPEVAAAPSVSAVGRAGEVAKVDVGRWVGDGVIAFSYQWQICDAEGLRCQDKPGRIFPSERLGDLDVGKRVRARVTATSALGSRVEFTGLSGVIAPEAPAVVAAPVALPPERDGGALVVSGGVWRGTRPFAFEIQWQQCDPSGIACVDVIGANSDSLVPSLFAAGSTFRALVRVSNSAGSVLSPSTPTKAEAVSSGGSSTGVAAAGAARALQSHSKTARAARRLSCSGNPYILTGGAPVATSSGGSHTDVVEGDTVSTTDGTWGVPSFPCSYSPSFFSYSYAWRGGGFQLARACAFFCVSVC